MVPGTKTLRYFDAVAGVVSFVIAARVLTPGVAASWDLPTGLVVGLFLTALAAAITFRPHLYRQNAPWLAGAFAGAALLALIVTFWRAPVVVFLGTVALGAIALTVALVLRRKPLLERP